VKGPFSIVANTPVVRQSDESFSEQLDTEKESYTISEGIGFDQATFTLTGSPDYLLDWFDKGLVYDTVWTSPEGSIAWEGYIARLSLSVGDTVIIKSIDEMANRIIHNYVPLDTAETPPVAGAQTTITKNDTASQARYGIKTLITSGAECTDATADDDALAYLTHHSQIPLTNTISVGQGKAPTLQVTMRGYAYMANWYAYSQTVSSGTANANTIVSAVLAADPNSVLSTSTLDIDTNTTATEQYRDDNPLAWKFIQEMATRGQESGGTGYQWSCGVYADRRTTFKAKEGIDSSGVAYSTNKHQILQRHIMDAADMFLEESGREVLPWELRPDRLLYTQGIPGPPMYITQVKFSLPHRVVLQGTSIVDPLKLTLSESCR
jgi:hypothetical protein